MDTRAHVPRSALPSYCFGATVPNPEGDLNVHERFERQAASTPDAVAVQLGERSLTYRQLNEGANQIAHYLRAQGIKPNMLVGISLDRSLEVVAGIYGILKSGAAYVPLDPSYPSQRLRSMVETARVGTVLTDSRVATTFAGLPNLNVVQLDSVTEALASQSTANPSRSATPDDLVYIIFTSGSTGQPKTAGVYHRGFSNLLHWFVTDFQISAADRALLSSSLSFDLTQKNLYATLLQGGELHLYPPGPYDVTLLSRLIDAKGITLLNCTPSAFYPLVELPDEDSLQRLRSLRLVFLGGEPISIPRLERWMNHPLCRADVANTYGPTECTDICGAYRMTRENRHRYDFVPLGRPVFNVQLTILDTELNPCPVGTPGELCVTGAGVGAGYLNDSALTAQKFIANPFYDLPGKTLYRTGDQAKWLPEGVISFLGRIDHQVKIRGFRIELNEIEASLNLHPALREAIVVVKEGRVPGTDPRLVSYFTCKNQETPAPSALKTYLRNSLPEYMIPAFFKSLQVFPLSPNGKVDRRALQELPVTETAAPAPSPATGYDAEIRAVWTSVLGANEVGADDNFFDIGGNSLNLAEVHGLLQQRFGREFPITDLFAHTTVRALAAHFGQSRSNAGAINAAQERALRQRDAVANRRPVRR